MNTKDKLKKTIYTVTKISYILNITDILSFYHKNLVYKRIS